MSIKKELLNIQKVKVSTIVELSKKLNYFTLNKRYEVDHMSFDNGKGAFEITLIDDENSKHLLDERYFVKHFKISGIQ